MTFKNVGKNTVNMEGQTKHNVSSTKNMFGRDIFLMDESENFLTDENNVKLTEAGGSIKNIYTKTI